MAGTTDGGRGVIEGELAHRAWGIAPPTLSVLGDGRPVMAQIRDRLAALAPGAPARVRVEAEGARTREAVGPWEADWQLLWRMSGEEAGSGGMVAHEVCRVGGHDVAAYLRELAARRPGRRVRIEVAAV